jgi:hypothetical protein
MRHASKSPSVEVCSLQQPGSKLHHMWGAEARLYPNINAVLSAA